MSYFWTIAFEANFLLIVVWGPRLPLDVQTLSY